MGKKLPPGFRFHPTDVELVMYHLKRKVLGRRFLMDAIAEVDIYQFAPWDLPDKSLLRTGDLKWYFFCPREKKYACGSRMNRATECGFWKSTGKDRSVYYNGEVVGSIKTLVFHTGKAPKGDRTDWVIYEYKLEQSEMSTSRVAQDSYVLCSLFKKDGRGPKNGAQYGAPFREEDWEDDDDDDEMNEDDDVVNGVEVAVTPVDVQVQVDQNGVLATENSHVPECERESTLVFPAQTLMSDGNVDGRAATAAAADYSVACSAPMLPTQDFANEDDDIIALLGNFTEEDAVMEMFDAPVPQDGGANHPVLDGLDIYNDLEDLHSLVGFDRHDYGARSTFGMDNGGGQYLELMDLEAPLNFSAEAANGQVQAGGYLVPPFFAWGDGIHARDSGGAVDGDGEGSSGCHRVGNEF